MNIIIAPDSFKDALESIKVAEAISRGVLRVVPDATITLCPMADGGEGTCDVLAIDTNWKAMPQKVKGPKFQPVDSKWLLSSDGSNAFVEMATASGLQLLPISERNPMETTTFGTGQLIKAALGYGVQKVMMGIGGSATNDCGIGMAAALGWLFLSESGQELEPVGKNLGLICQIVPPKDSASAEFEIWCDVDNPMFGPSGAAFTYARQKGASEVEIIQLDNGLRHFSSILLKHFGKDFSLLPGAGAAGGLGAGGLAFLNASIRSGIEAILEARGFKEKLKYAGLVITGEGRIDNQTKHGKVIKGICRAASIHNVPVIGLCGFLQAKPEEIREIGLEAAFAINDGSMTLEESLASTAEDLERTTASVLVSFLKDKIYY